MIQLAALLVLLDLMGVVEGPQLDETAITCYVCSSLDQKNCEDPMLDDVLESVPFFECNRLYGESDNSQVEYFHFRPTFHGRNLTENSTTVKNRRTTKAPKKTRSTSKIETKPTSFSKEEVNVLRFRRHWTFPRIFDSDNPTQVLPTHSEVHNGLLHLSSINNSQLWKKGRRIHLRPHEYAEKASGYEFEFFPFRTQRGPKGIDDQPQHYCYKLISEKGHDAVVHRGCTNVTTKSKACEYYYKKYPNVTTCEFCGVNFCNGAQGTMNSRTYKLVMGIFVCSFTINKIVTKCG